MAAILCNLLLLIYQPTRWAKVPCGKNDNHDLSNGVVIVFI